MGRMRRGAIAVTGLALLGASMTAQPSEGGSAVPEDAIVFFDVSVLSATDAWAVGERYAADDTGTTTIWHWDGEAWSEVESPSRPVPVSVLFSVEALSSTDVWAVGTSGEYLNFRTLVEHWDGTRWSIVHSPNPPREGDESRLFGVSAAAPDDIWAVGESRFLNLDVIEHWNGKRWRLVPGATPDAGLEDVLAWGPDDAWAVGRDGIEHWDGSSWTVSSTRASLDSIAGSSPSDMWAVGGTLTSTLTEHWDGTSWKVVRSRQSGHGHTNLTGVASISGADVWAVGERQDHGDYVPLSEHWDGHAWQKVLFDSDQSLPIFVYTVDGSAADDVWAVGNPRSRTGFGWIAHWDGIRWTQYLP